MCEEEENIHPFFSDKVNKLKYKGISTTILDRIHQRRVYKTYSVYVFGPNFCLSETKRNCFPLNES